MVDDNATPRRSTRTSRSSRAAPNADGAIGTLTTTRSASSQASRRPPTPPIANVTATCAASTSHDAQFRICAAVAHALLDDRSKIRTGTTHSVAMKTGIVARR